MKKILYAIAAVALVLSVSSCGSSSPEDYAKKMVQLETKEKNLRAEAYEKAVEQKDKEFIKKMDEATEKLEKEDSDLKELENKLKTAKEEYNKIKKD